ncbi:MAG: helix-turn-helix domain-containing protein [Pseudomonas sp.]|uniref:helix-turn-helix domain-containing protein n=1 Tax=Pseudomonas sp. TaxID=306 RepID=UPI00398274FD
MLMDQRAGESIAITAKNLSSIVVEAACVQAAQQPWIAMECYQLGRGRQLTQMDSLDLGSQQVVRESQMVAVQKLGVTPQNLCTLSYCTSDPSFRFSELGANAANTVFFMPEHTEFDIFVPAGVQTAYVSLNQDEFLSGARTLNPAQWERTPEQLQHIQTGQQATLQATISQWFSTLSASHTSVDTDLMNRLLLQSILQVAAGTNADIATPSALERSRALHICRIARCFVEESLAADVVPSIVDVCTAAGVSERALQYAFRTYVDMPPIAYLRRCRLNRVRATLRTSDPQTTTVTQIAMRFGFLHLGRFAQDYRQLFDESPSVTLAC